jgi:hypothetical protein
MGLLELAGELSAPGEKQVPMMEVDKKPSGFTVAVEAPAPPSPAENDKSKTWEDVLEQVKAAKVTTHALLAPAQVIDWNEAVLTLGYKPELRFHREKMEEKANQEILLGALKRVLGKDMKLKLISLDEETQQSQVVKKALELFGPNKVEIID